MFLIQIAHPFLPPIIIAKFSSIPVNGFHHHQTDKALCGRPICLQTKVVLLLKSLCTLKKIGVLLLRSVNLDNLINPLFKE